MILSELKASLELKITGLSREDLLIALRRALLDCNIAIALAGGRGSIAIEKLTYVKRGFEVDKTHYGQEMVKADTELEVLFNYKHAFQEWFDEVSRCRTGARQTY